MVMRWFYHGLALEALAGVISLVSSEIDPCKVCVRDLLLNMILVGRILRGFRIVARLGLSLSMKTKAAIWTCSSLVMDLNKVYRLEFYDDMLPEFGTRKFLLSFSFTGIGSPCIYRPSAVEKCLFSYLHFSILFNDNHKDTINVFPPSTRISVLLNSHNADFKDFRTDFNWFSPIGFD
ncbi:hypothetical protein RYX36_004499 [Vicia faba]